MLERELKLYIPLTQQSAVMKAVQQLPTAKKIRLAAQYFDTPQRDLALQGAALRLRLENGQWVQTLKTRANDALSNKEYNHLRPDASLDFTVYDNTPAATLFTTLSAPLEKRYQTDVNRITAVLSTEKADIELALDFGEIQAKNQRIAISELEFELKKGEMAEVFNTALTWLDAYHLLLELRSKAERGDALYEGSLTKSQPIHPSQPQNQHQSLAESYTHSASTFLYQIIRHAAFVAGIDNTNDNDNDNDNNKKSQAHYLLQMRVAIRRLRSCRQLFKPWLTKEERHLAKRLRTYYKAFGAWRDSDMLWLELQPKLEKAGLPAAQELTPLKETAHTKASTPQHLASRADFQRLLVESLANLLLNQAFKTPDHGSKNVSEQLPLRLNKWLKRIQQQSAKFDALNPSSQHDLRNRVKRMRYNLEVLGHTTDQPLYAALAEAQNQLGDLCDAYVARSWYIKHSISKKQKKFALAWLEKRITKKHASSKNALSALGKTIHPITLPQTH